MTMIAQETTKPAQQTGEKKLNIGCGRDVREGWVNMDGFVVLPGVLKHDLRDTPWPLESNTFDHVLASHVLEHIMITERNGRDVIWDVLEEVHRVLKPGGVFEVKVPLGNTLAAFKHANHYRMHFVPEWFEYVTGIADPYVSNVRFERITPRGKETRRCLEHSQIRFQGGPMIRGLYVIEHVLARAPSLRKYVLQKDELHVFLRKPMDAR